MHRNFIGFAIVAALVAGFFMVLPEPVAPQPGAWPAQEGNDFVLRGVRVFDGERVRERVDVLVQGGMISAVSPKVPVPKGTPEFAADGHTLMPAFIDAHTHNFGDSLTDALLFGVATQIDMFTGAARLPAARAQRESLAWTAQADMWSAGTLVTAQGGHGTQFGMPIPTLDDAADAVGFVDARIAEGSDFIKLVLEHGWTDPMPTLDEATLAAAIAAARSRDKLAVVHVGTHAEAETAVRSGADGLVHLFHDAVVDDALVAALVEREAFVIPTLSVLESLAGGDNGVADDARMAPWLTPEQEDGLRRRFPAGSADAGTLTRALTSTRLLHEAGVTVLAGSDAPNPGTAHGASLHRELELLVEAGLPTAVVLAAATSAAARAFSIEDRGRIARDMRADLVLVGGDPLADITATRAISAIWKNGYRVERARFDRAAAGSELTDDSLGVFDDDEDGWIPTTDGIQGGHSQVTLTVDGGVLALEVQVRAGAPWPWAGAMKMLAAQPMEPVDLTAYSTLALRLRGQGPVQVLFFSGASAQGMPQVWPLAQDWDWTEVDIPLDDVNGLDRGRVRAVAVVAGGAPHATRIEIDSVVLR